MSKKVVGSMSEWSGRLRDLFRQIDDGSLTLRQVQAFLEHRNPFGIEVLISGWEDFYQEVFGIKTDLSNLRIPKQKPGFDRLIIVAQGMTAQRVYDKCKELFPCWKYTALNLDEDIKTKQRTAAKRGYAFWVRDQVEPDPELNNLSAEDIEERMISTETLTERLIHELRYFKETGKHLDVGNITLCSGSRASNFHTLIVHWACGKMRVSRIGPQDCSTRLRCRQVVL